ncbi:Uncharacterised protein [Candidatus Gugararchaeum adminiculabundum]|nr:Uncharacterised protein [Candidatus Gugararchaeum adminiculabundum]
MPRSPARQTTRSYTFKNIKRATYGMLLTPKISPEIRTMRNEIAPKLRPKFSPCLFHSLLVKDPEKKQKIADKLIEKNDQKRKICKEVAVKPFDHEAFAAFWKLKAEQTHAQFSKRAMAVGFGLMAVSLLTPPQYAPGALEISGILLLFSYLDFAFKLLDCEEALKKEQNSSNSSSPWWHSARIDIVFDAANKRIRNWAEGKSGN